MRYGVSVWIPNRNHGDHIGTAIYSAAKECPIEVLVLDDASTDHSIEVIKQACSTYNNCRYIRYPSKSESWEKAAYPHILSLKGQHIISLSADDELCNGYAFSSMRYKNAAIIFQSYYVRQKNQQPIDIVRTPFKDESVLNNEQVCDLFLSNTGPMETGIGSSIRYDWQQWLIEKEYHKMGPYADCFGFSAVAALGGAVYIPNISAIFTIDENSYGATNRTIEKNLQHKIEVIKFFDRAGIRKDVAESLMRKRGL